MSREARVWNKIQKLRDEYKRMMIASSSTLSLAHSVSVSIDKEFRSDGTFIPNLFTSHKSYRDIDDEINGFEVFVRNYIKDYRKKARRIIDAENRMEQILAEIGETIESFWPDGCHEFKNKHILFASDMYNPKERELLDGVSGVYFLWSKTGLDYIGQSQDLFNRLRVHDHVERERHYIGIIPIDGRDNRLSLESYFITLYHPRINKYTSTKHVWAGNDATINS